MYNTVVMAHMMSSGQQAQLYGGGPVTTSTTTGGLGNSQVTRAIGGSGLGQYVQYMPSVIDELFESQRWMYVRKSKDHGKKVGETADII